ncbi:MAG TPA: hypothetical protein VMV83_08770 [Rectinemataceae bacterium]|nr:hypothetical protein [Rectinemataceae bacterium]
MDQLQNEIRVATLDPEINAILEGLPAEGEDKDYGVLFSQSEELHLVLPRELVFPKLPIHHDVHDPEPAASYIRALRAFVADLITLLPASFRGLTYYFDPAEILRPCFYRLYKVEESVYLFHLRLNLAQHPFEGQILEAGSNDYTSAYSSNKLWVESEFIPLDAVMWELGRVKAFRIHQMISNTWIGETRRGHYIQGIWMDDGLSRFFTKLFLPDGARIYPWFPIFCKYKTVCAMSPTPDPQGRRRILPLLHRAISFLGPEMEKIQRSLKDSEFSDKMPEFLEMRSRVPAGWKDIFRGFSSRPYLNGRDQKEYALAVPDTQAV